jgi:diguanylate cyclase (GGDEF)-like protein
MTDPNDSDWRKAGKTQRLPSIRTRYAQLFAIFAAALAVVALLAWRQLSSTGEGYASEVRLLEQNVALIDDSHAQLFRVRHQMYEFLMVPSLETRTQLRTALEGLQRVTSRLAEKGHWGDAADKGAIARLLPQDAASLASEINALLETGLAESPRQSAAPALGRPAGSRDSQRTDDPVVLLPLADNGRIALPLLQALDRQLETLGTEMEARRLTRIEQVADLSRRLGATVFSALGLMLLLGIVAYLGLDRLILRPVRRLTDNLNAHPGGASLPDIAPAVRESRGLLDVFVALKGQIKARERELDHLAHHDSLTGLPNRDLFRRRLAEAISVAEQDGMPVGVLFMDLDRFKQVNDSYGHLVGDAMLIEISRRLRKVFRQDDVVARLGGDEFAVLLENLHQREEMTRMAQKALSAIQRPYEVAGRIFHSGASMGIAVAPDDGTDPDRLIQLADTAMYAAKQDEGSSYRYVSPELTAEAAARHALENELREAIARGQLELHFQPVLSTSDGHLHCYESLLRWPHAEQGMLRPASFMNALADAGLCSAISDWALDQIQSKRPDDHAVVSINLSARLLHDEVFAQRLFERIDVGRLVPAELIIEITEDTLETDLRAAARVLHELKRRGVQIALDDFGTGQASLSHLRRFPFDYIKIDQSFIAGIGKVRNDEKLIQAIIRLAHALGMRVVAEGVEIGVQRDFLVAEGCDFIQGYLVGKPTASGQSKP